MGRVRTKTVKKASRVIIERYYSRMTLDFQTNKKIAEEVAIIPSKRLRNKIAGFATHLMRRIQKGPVRGISLKLQEEERERRMDFVPEESEIKTDVIEVDKETQDLLHSLGMGTLPGVVQVSFSFDLFVFSSIFWFSQTIDSFVGCHHRRRGRYRRSGRILLPTEPGKQASLKISCKTSQERILGTPFSSVRSLGFI
ncbi:40S ribosomal protein S17 isoform X1 [Selaginella moellendorffii]|uniref:40S ribosomal protein S17 isoform X1 n=1 Tax=Selaginella moellendorffii TaxID=88036 RepID=UPI000D1CFB72|nr:40S ribosomal protein S17 isoform X1 [Selaginella moellendorffii]|eukprot:XP_024532491.1 40S ribosomal protein S17 isoform X1 [Selaginella moellendorffii]